MHKLVTQLSLFKTAFVCGAFLLLSLVTNASQAACPATVGTTSPIVYQDCVQLINNNPGNPSSVVINTSANTQVGDYQVLVVVSNIASNTATITTPTGWTVIMTSTRNGADGNDDVLVGIYAKFAAAAGTEAVTVVGNTGDPADNLLMWVMRFSNTTGWDATGAANAVSAPAGSATVTSPSITTSAVNSLVLRVVGIDFNVTNNADTAGIFGGTTIIERATSSTSHATTGVATYNIQAAAGAAAAGSTLTLSGAQEWVARTFALKASPYFTIVHPASNSACTYASVTITARNIDGSINAAYLGNITLATNTNHGYWSRVGGTATGTLVTSGNDDGAGTYSFTAADNGTVVLSFYDPNVEAVNFDVVDSSLSTMRELKTAANDSTMTVNACSTVAPAQFNQSCVIDSDGNNSMGLTHAALPASTTANRMVVVIWSGEQQGGLLPAATATYNGVAMQSLVFQSISSNANNYTQIFALKHSALPTAAGNYGVLINGTASEGAVCAFTLTGVDQDYPAGNGALYPVNSNSMPSGNAVISTVIKPVVANSYVMAGVGNGTGSNQYNHSLTTELYDVVTAGPLLANISISAQTLATSNQLTVTDTWGGGNGSALRSSQVVAAFAPPIHHYFRLTHAGTAGICGSAPITITAVDQNGTTETSYNRTITLTADGSGDWSLGSGALGSLNNGTLDDGIATYTFAAGDNGRVVLNYGHSTLGTVNFNVVDMSDPARVVDPNPTYDANLVFSNCEYRISHDGVGSNCGPENITFSVVTSTGAPATGFTGTINLSTVTAAADKGSWALKTGGGTLTDATPSDGIASYTFNAADNGVVVLGFTTKNTGTYNFNVTGSTYLVNPAFDADLAVGTCKFRISYTGGATSDVCSKKEVVISAVDNAGSVIVGFTGQVLLSTTTGHGTWEKSGVQPGTLNDPFSNDGSASYTFVAGDNGDVALLLSTPETESLKVDVRTLDGVTRVDTNPTYNPDLLVGQCTFHISFTSGTMTSCTAATISIAVYNSQNTVATNYTGTVNLSTSSNNGDWVATAGSGTLNNAAVDDGAAIYTFVSADAGVASFTFRDEHEGDINIGVVANLDNNFVVNQGFNPKLKINPCLPEITAAICYRSQNQSNAITLPSASSTNSSRMVLMYVASESTVSATTARLTSGSSTYNMTALSDISYGSTMRLQVFGIKDVNLPAGGGALTARFDGTYSAGVNDPSMCLVTFEGAKQVFPATASPSSKGQLNSRVGDGVATSTVDITTKDNNAIILSSLVTGTDSVNFSSATQSSVLWNNGTSSPGPAGARFTGRSSLQSVASGVSTTIAGSATFSPFAHISLVISPIVAGNPYASNYVPVQLFDTLSGNLGYRAIGNSLRTLQNDASPSGQGYPDSCAIGPSAASVLTLPTGSKVEKAYLYWAGSGAAAFVDDTVNFGPTGNLSSVTADDVFKITNTPSNGYSFFLGYKDVTGLVSATTPQSYTLSGLAVQTGAPFISSGACVSGWALVVVYQNTAENPYVTVVNLFHGFQPFQNSSFTLAPRNFRIAEPNSALGIPRGQITHVTFEGDSTLSGADEAFELQNDPNALTFLSLTNTPNPPTSQYNNTISFPSYDSAFNFTGYTTQSSTSYGTDVDTYYIAGAQATASDPKESILYPFGIAKSEEITTRYGADQDLVLLGAEFIEVTNSTVADLEVFASSAGVFKVGSSGSGILNFNVVNNGDNAISNGYATGSVVLTSRLPSGLTINTMNPGAHWNCTNTLSAFTCTFDIESWTGGTFDTSKMVYRLDDGGSLPSVSLTVNVGNYTSFPLKDNLGLVTGRIAHFDSPVASCVATESVGYQPDPTHSACLKADEFDNVDDLNKNTIDIDDLVQKQPNNNNLDRTSFAIPGVRTDLSVVLSALGVVQHGLPAVYQVVVTNNGTDATTNSHPMQAVVTFPAGVTPINPGSVDGWTCSLASSTLSCLRTTPLAASASSTITVNTAAVTAAVGSYIYVTATIASGTYNFDNNSSNNSSTAVNVVVGPVTPLNDRFLLSVTEAATLGSNALSFGPEDLVLYDPVNDFTTMFMDVSALSNTSLANINDIHVLPNGWVVLAADGNSTLLGVSFSHEDLVLYDPILGTARLIFDGSDSNKFGAFAAAATIDAVHVDYHASWDPLDWDIYLSTKADSNLNGTAFDDNDFVKYNMRTGAVTAIFDGANANKFSSDNGNISALYIRNDDPNKYVMATASATATIDTGTAFTRDDLVQWNAGGADGSRASRVFVGDQTPGVFLPTSATRAVDGVHVVEEAYYGHFAISTLAGSTCKAARVTIAQHAGLTHSVNANYQGSIRITASSNTTHWLPDASNQGTFVEVGGGVAIYTFAAADNGVVVLGLTADAPISNVNINVTNGLIGENSAEDSSVDITLDKIGINYLDNFNASVYTANDGSTNFSAPWVEVNDDGLATAGDISIVGGKLRLRDSSGAPYAAIYRVINFDYTADTLSNPLRLKFTWARSGGSNVDSFVAEWSQNSGSSWTQVGPVFGSASSGPILDTLESFNLTAAGVNAVAGQHLWIRFRVVSGLSSAYVATIDNVEISTATTSTCNPGHAVHHYHISSMGTSIACLADTVTFTAHDASHHAVQPGAGVVLNISTANGKGGWNAPTVGGGVFTASPVTNNGLATYTFLAGESSVTLPFNYTNLATDPEVVNFNVIDGNNVVEQEESNLSVSRAGLRFYNETDGNTQWPTLTAGRPATTLNDYTGKTLVVQAIRVSDDNPNQCVALFPANSVRPVQLLFECSTPGSCAASNSTIGVYNNSATTQVNTVNNNGGSWVANSDLAEFTTVNLLFQNFGAYTAARLQLNSPDVGRYEIHGRYNIALGNDGSGAKGYSGNYMVGSGPLFVVRPFGLDVDFGMSGNDRRTNTDASRAVDALSPAYAKAGQDIPVTIRAVGWDAADDSNGDGVPDFEADLSDNAITPSFGQEGLAYHIGLSVITDNPLIAGVNDNPGVPGGVVGVLTQSSKVFGFSNGVSTSNNAVAFNEVGIFDVKAELLDAMDAPVNYLSILGGSQPVIGGAANVGRITPFYYDFNTGGSFLLERPDAGGASVFTYMGEPFEVTLSMLAKNASGAVLQNYFGAFAKLTDVAHVTAGSNSGQFVFKAFKDDDGAGVDDVDYSARLSAVPSSFGFTSNWAAGLATLKGRLIFNRQGSGAEEAPLQQLTIAVDIKDSDDVEELANVGDDDGTNETSNYTWHSVDTNEWRYGRLRLENAYGSELQELDSVGVPIGHDVSMGLVTEYWNGTKFVVNKDDSGSVFNIAQLFPVTMARYPMLADTYSDNLSPGEFLATPGTSKVNAGQTLAQSGPNQPFYFRAPGEGNDGSVVMEFDLDAANLSFLKFDWRSANGAIVEDENADGVYNDFPRALLEFGTYKGNDRIINWQELFIQEP